MSPLLFWNAFLLYPIYWVFKKLLMDVEYWQMLLCVCWDNHIAFIVLFFFDVVYHIYSYLDVEPSLPLVSTFHLPLSVSGTRFQALTPLLVPPGSLVPCRCQFNWFHCLGHWDGELLSWACLSHSLYHCGGWRGWMGSLVARVSAMSSAVTKPCRLHCCGGGKSLYWAPQFYQLPFHKPHPSPCRCSPGWL